MNTINNRQPAFPCGTDTNDIGMTLRDYMAIHASDGDISAQIEDMREQLRKRGGTGVLPDGWYLKARYMHADAMLKARES
jgi:hypothetical protein